ncbi:PIN/TRAM domain-containing protein [Halanaerobium hydrogeniformans]|uniref:PilT protein domain protein n=1 Tax=Halanaerobium hydrogeniformans TaxID=656519 RepID=E4RJE4_HALHG|nr:PIN domain-containing protein [Halanaerobium hydrogeniformans]ADQ15364.1 PilT protein domain protein [Halanaerobium hydrogeniformans]
MLKKIMRYIFAIFGGIIAYHLVDIFGLATEYQFSWQNIGDFFLTTQFFAVLLGFLLGYFIIYYSLNQLLNFIMDFEVKVKDITWKKIVIAIIGLIIGLILGAIINFVFSIPNIPRIGMPLQILINITFTYMGFALAIHKEKEISSFIFQSNKENLDFTKADKTGSDKILDTSVIIDGRIFDICKTGFIEGNFIIPEFVLEELQHIADSSDDLKRNRGRRGLDILRQMQNDVKIKVKIIDADFEEISEVDSKLVRLAKNLDAKVLTNDYNLNKVAELQGVNVLNINELANAVKPVVLPGEQMDVKVIKEGKENGQGVAYLDDGTMIVIEDGVKYIGDDISVLVTSILQTAAGRMIFARPKTN